MIYSDDQASAFDAASEALMSAGIDLKNENLLPQSENKNKILAILGKAGSGKTLLLAELAEALSNAGVELISGDYEGKPRKDRRTLAILAPTNKAASVLRNRGVQATTIHRILYTPMYDPEYEKFSEWLSGNDERPVIEGLNDIALERAALFFKNNKSIPGALAAAGLRGSDFIIGWKRREEPLDIGFIDESSMLDDRQFEDLQEIFSTLILFGDPAQLAPVGQSGEMAFENVPKSRQCHLTRIHRQAGDSPILDLAHLLSEPNLSFQEFERQIEEMSLKDDRVVLAQSVQCDLMSRSPVLVWRNSSTALITGIDYGERSIRFLDVASITAGWYFSRKNITSDVSSGNSFIYFGCRNWVKGGTRFIHQNYFRANCD